MGDELAALQSAKRDAIEREDWPAYHRLEGLQAKWAEAIRAFEKARGNDDVFALIDAARSGAAKGGANG